MLKRWLKRYWLAEAVGIATALISVLVVMQMDGSYLAAAIIAPWGENIGYYSTILLRELRANLKSAGAFRWSTVLVTIRDLSMEFGPAELIDSLLVRPTLMYFGQQFLGHMTAGIIMGKVAADIVFYIPVVIAYETRRLLQAKP